ncbi:hypothetical protein JB92DRAFT_3138015 [Gautieria morchelliformis]|nr:hypothetical protein JB92DRAFT_3138015 [Gautieria morchelliformis]
MSPDVDVDKPTEIWRAPTVERLSMLHTSQADIIVSIGGSSYTGAAKIALIVHSSLKNSELSVSPMDTLFAKLSDNGDITPSKALKDPGQRGVARH